MKTITPYHAFDLIRNKMCLLLDVREEDEYKALHIQDSLLMPLSCFDPDHLPHTTHPVIVYCRSGARSAHAATLISSIHPELEVYNLEGGILEWQRQGFDVI